MYHCFKDSSFLFLTATFLINNKLKTVRLIFHIKTISLIYLLMKDYVARPLHGALSIFWDRISWDRTYNYRNVLDQWNCIFTEKIWKFRATNSIAIEKEIAVHFLKSQTFLQLHILDNAFDLSFRSWAICCVLGVGRNVALQRGEAKMLHFDKKCHTHHQSTPQRRRPTPSHKRLTQILLAQLSKLLPNI